ncbi:MAG: SMC-Scp complex subunit ScpB [Clostridia bacterium]|nr:SMC-Scp complex subunit ScpB [Clostridia bacterium]
MEIEKNKGIIEAILFSAGRVVTIDELMMGLEVSKEDIQSLIQNMQEDYKKQNRGIEIVKVDNGYQLASKTDLYDYIYPILDKRAKPRLSTAALETLSIIAYNPRITRAEIEAIRGVNADGAIYKLLEFGLIELAGKLDAPGRPTTYKTSNEFLKMFGYSSLDDLPELPKYKLDENKQIVIDELVEENNKGEDKNETITSRNGDN